eukprot:2028416-Prymnesium_polylepis.1
MSIGHARPFSSMNTLGAAFWCCQPTGLVCQRPSVPKHLGSAHGSEPMPACWQRAVALSVARLITTMLVPSVTWSYRLGRARSVKLSMVRIGTRSRSITLLVVSAGKGDSFAPMPCIFLETSFRIQSDSRVEAISMSER